MKLKKGNIKNSIPTALRDADGRYIVNLNVTDDSNFLSVFSVSEHPVISSEVAEFLDFNTQLLPPEADIVLRIHGDCVDENEQRIYPAAIRQYYQEQQIVAAKELRRNRIIALFLGAIGVLCLSAMLATSSFFPNEVWPEVMDVVAWVFLWEAVDIYFFKSRELKARVKRCAAYCRMKVEYPQKETASA